VIPGYSFTRVLFTNAKRTRGCGCHGHPAFPTPSKGERFINASGAWRGEVVNVCLGVIASQRVARMRARLARNDGLCSLKIESDVRNSADRGLDR
jgi:hypothetical protein